MFLEANQMHESFIDSHASCTGWIESLRPGWSDEMVPAEAPGSTRRRRGRRTIRLALDVRKGPARRRGASATRG